MITLAVENLGLSIYKECSKIIVNSFCKKTNKHLGIYIGYGNEKQIINKIKIMTKNEKMSPPHVENYECYNDYCKCEYIKYYSLG